MHDIDRITRNRSFTFDEETIKAALEMKMDEEISRIQFSVSHKDLAFRLSSTIKYFCHLFIWK